MAAAIRFDSPTQEGIHRRLSEMIGPGSAAFFADACRLTRRRTGRLDPASGGEAIREEPLETTNHLVGHCLREIEGALRDVLLPDKSKRGTHEAQIRAILKDLDIPETDPVGSYWFSLAGHAPDALHKRAHRDNLGPPRPLDGEFDRAWQKTQALLDLVLDKFQTRYARVFVRLDQLAALTKPTAAQIQELKVSIPHTVATHRHFFGKLASAEWIEPLEAEGFFKSPPEVIRDGDRVSLPDWPQADYLERVAGINPTAVTRVILAVSTSNPRVQWQLVGVALKLPAREAAKLADLIATWMPELSRAEFVDPVTKLIEHVATAGRKREVMRLARALYGERGAE